MPLIINFKIDAGEKTLCSSKLLRLFRIQKTKKLWEILKMCNWRYCTVGIMLPYRSTFLSFSEQIPLNLAKVQQLRQI